MRQRREQSPSLYVMKHLGALREKLFSQVSSPGAGELGIRLPVPSANSMALSLALPASGDQVEKVPGTRKSSWFNRLLQLEGVELTHMRMTSLGDVGWVPTASTVVASCLSYQHYLARSFLSFYPGGLGTVVGGDRRGSRCRRSRGKSYDWTCCYSNTHKCVSVRFES